MTVLLAHYVLFPVAAATSDERLSAIEAAAAEMLAESDTESEASEGVLHALRTVIYFAIQTAIACNFSQKQRAISDFPPLLTEITCNCSQNAVMRTELRV